STGTFTRKATRDICSMSLGVPGAIEALAAEAVRRALNAGTTSVAPEHVQAAASALRAQRAPSDPAPLLPPRQPRPEVPQEVRAPASASAAHPPASADMGRPPLTPSGRVPSPD